MVDIAVKGTKDLLPLYLIASAPSQQPSHRDILSRTPFRRFYSDQRDVQANYARMVVLAGLLHVTSPHREAETVATTAQLPLTRASVFIINLV